MMTYMLSQSLCLIQYFAMSATTTKNNTVRFVFFPQLSYLRYLCLFAHSGVQHILCCVFDLFYRPGYPMLPVSLGSPFLMGPFGILQRLFKQIHQKLLYICLITRMNLQQFYIHTNIFISTTIKQNELIFNLFTCNRISHFEVIKNITTLIITPN